MHPRRPPSVVLTVLGASGFLLLALFSPFPSVPGLIWRFTLYEMAKGFSAVPTRPSKRVEYPEPVIRALLEPMNFDGAFNRSNCMEPCSSSACPWQVLEPKDIEYLTVPADRVIAVMRFSGDQDRISAIYTEDEGPIDDPSELAPLHLVATICPTPEGGTALVTWTTTIDPEMHASVAQSICSVALYGPTWRDRLDGPILFQE